MINFDEEEIIGYTLLNNKKCCIAAERNNITNYHRNFIFIRVSSYWNLLVSTFITFKIIPLQKDKVF